MIARKTDARIHPGLCPVLIIFIFIPFVLAACESRPRTGLEWKEVVLKKEGVSIQCPVDFSSPSPILQDEVSVYCASSEANYTLSVEPWYRSDNEEENRKSAFEKIKNTKLLNNEMISSDTVWRGDMMVQESVGISTSALERSTIAKLLSTDPKTVWFERAFVIGKKFYQMGVSYDIPDRDSYAVTLNNMREDREKFFASFHILNEK